jgi:beta-glucosidase
VLAATASSVESNHFVGYWAVDGTRDSRWASEGPIADGAPDTQWLKLDLGGICFIDSINLEWERAYSRDYVIQISNDGVDDDDESWTDVPITSLEEIISREEATAGHVRFRMLNVRARFVRIYSTRGDRNYGISLYEVAIFGDLEWDCKQKTKEAMECPGTFIKLAASAASASSEERWDVSADKAIDEDMDTRWSSEFNEGESIIFDLGALTLIDSVWLFWERAYAVGYELQAGESESQDGLWSTIVTITDSDGGVDIIGGFAQPVVARYLRILSAVKKSKNYGISLTEFEVHGNQEEGCAYI